MERTMSRIASACLVTGLAALVASPAHASPTADVSLGAFVDDTSGTSFDLSGSFSPNEWWTLSAGIGQSKSSQDLADLTGRVVHASAQVAGKSLGSRLSFSNWDDSGSFQSQTIGGQFFWRNGGLQLSALLENRRLDVDYTIVLPLRRIPQSQSFDGNGYGAEVSYYGERWGGYVRGLTYDYDAALDRLIAASQLPNLEQFPRIQALVGSLLTRTAGAQDYDLSAGIDRAFQRSGVRLDLWRSRDAITGADSQDISVSYRYSISPRVEIEGSVGVTDSDNFDSLTHGGLTLTFRN